MSISKTPSGIYSHQPKIDYSQVDCPQCSLQAQQISLLSCFITPQANSALQCSVSAAHSGCPTLCKLYKVLDGQTLMPHLQEVQSTSPGLLPCHSQVALPGLQVNACLQNISTLLSIRSLDHFPRVLSTNINLFWIPSHLYFPAQYLLQRIGRV